MDQKTIDFLTELHQLCIKYNAGIDGGCYQGSPSIVVNGVYTDYLYVDKNQLTLDGKTLDELKEV